MVAGRHVEAVNPIGQIYINILLATVGPLILLAIVSAITSLGSLEKLRSIGLRSIFWLLLSNALAVVLALGLGTAFQPGHGVHHTLGAVSTDTIQGQVQSFSNVVVSFFPTNVVQNFSANDIIPIILIAVTLSVAYLALAEKEPEKVRPVRDGAEGAQARRVQGRRLRHPAHAVRDRLAHGLHGRQQHEPRKRLPVAHRAAGARLGRVPPAHLRHQRGDPQGLRGRAGDRVLPQDLPAQLTAFTTQSSIGTLPVTTARLTRQVGVNPEIAHFTTPLGATIGMPGCAGIWPILIAVWGINAYGIHYTAGQYAVLAILGVVVSVGTAGVPGAATVAAATVLSAANLPLEFVAVTIPISMIADMARTATNVTAAAVSATVVARQTGLLDDEIFAGRAEFLDADELAESEVVTHDAPVDPYLDVRVLDAVLDQDKELVNA